MGNLYRPATLLLVALVSLTGCLSSSTTHIPASQSLSEAQASDGEKAVFQAVQSTPDGARIAGVSRFKFDLSTLPPGTSLKKAVFSMYAVDKEVLAHSLSNRSVAELGPVISPISMLESDTLKAGYKPLPCTASSMKWRTSAWSILSVGGGTGGRGTFVLESPGWEEWDVTSLAREAAAGNERLCVAVGDFGSRRHPFLSRTIFSSSVIPQKWIYAGSQSDHAPRLIVWYD